MRLPFVLLVVSLWTGPTDAQSHKAWIWDKRDAKEIAKLEKAVTEESGRFHLESESWIIDTEVDARFTAELALFMDRFRTAFDGLLEGLHDGSQVEGKPRIYIWDTKEEYERAEPGGSRGYFRYTYDAQHKMRLTLYSFVDGAEERQFKFFYYLTYDGFCLLAFGAARTQNFDVFHNNYSLSANYDELGKRKDDIYHLRQKND